MLSKHKICLLDILIEFVFQKSSQTVRVKIWKAAATDASSKGYLQLGGVTSTEKQRLRRLRTASIIGGGRFSQRAWTTGGL
jgi:hypothetical protein